jgi:hypothetical protein
MGSKTLFTNMSSTYTPVTHLEILRAVLLADLALLVMTIAWIRAATDDRAKGLNLPEFAFHNRADAALKILALMRLKSLAGKDYLSRLNQKYRRTLSLRHIWRVVFIVTPIGLVSFILLTNIPGRDSSTIYLGEWESSSWVGITQLWAGLALLALIYWYGFRLWLIFPMGCYLMLMAIQGSGRSRAIIPFLLLTQIYLDRRRLKWPPPRLLIVLLAVLLLFYPLKTIGTMANKGASLTQIVKSSTAITRNALEGKNDDQQFLDQFASALTLIDNHGKLYYGFTYMSLFTLPIPRQWWHNKPGLADYIKDFSTPSRPMGETGMIVTFLGEAYANFSYVGIVLVSYLIAYWLARAYFSAYRRHYLSIARFFYLLVACNLIQVYRDRLISIVVFTCVNMMPLILIVLLHYILPMKVTGRKITSLPARALVESQPAN